MAEFVTATCFLLEVIPKVLSFNIAVYKPAYQSSAHYFQRCGFLNASKAVDNNKNPNTFSCHCSHIADVKGDPNWLAVDLGMEYKMDYVVIYNRNGDKLLSGRLSYFWSGLTNIDVKITAPQRGRYPLCGQYANEMSFTLMGVLKCSYNLPQGRFLIVQMDLNAGDGKAMAVCELEAYEVNENQQGFYWRPQNAIRLVGFKASSIFYLQSLMRCVATCISNTPKCDSINHDQEGNVCELNIHPNGFNSSSLVNLPQWRFWVGTF